MIDDERHTGGRTDLVAEGICDIDAKQPQSGSCASETHADGTNLIEKSDNANNHIVLLSQRSRRHLRNIDRTNVTWLIAS